MWGRLSDVANNVAGLVTPVNADQGNDELADIKNQLKAVQDERDGALKTLKERDQEILNLSAVVNSSKMNNTLDDIESIRHKLARISIDDSSVLDEVIAEISFSMSEKLTTIENLQGIIDDLREKKDQNMGEMEANSPTCNDFYESQISRLTELCTSLRQKEKMTISEVEDLKLELREVKMEMEELRMLKPESDPHERLTRLEEENRLLLSKVASEAAHKDILRDQLDTLRENDQEKYHLLESIKELQEALQSKTVELSAEREKVTDLTKQCDLLQGQITELLSEKQEKVQKNLFEVKEMETTNEEIERLAVENKMLINKISDLIASRDQAREEMELMTERSSSSRDSLLAELRDKDCELVDSMMIVSLLQEQIKGTRTEESVAEVLREMKEKSQIAPKLSFLQAELTEARKQLEDSSQRETELKQKLVDSQEGSRALASVSEEDEQASTSELQELITTAELLHDHYRVQCITPPETATEMEYMQAEVERLKECLKAREELISGLKEDINQRQEKESSYREKVAELYNEIEKSQVGSSVKDVIDFSESFVTGLEEQLLVAQKILKIKDEEIAGLNRVIRDASSRPRTPTSPALRYDSILDSNVKELNQKVADLNKQLVDEREETVKAQITIEELTGHISALQKDVAQKDLDLKRIDKEYETEMLNMSATFKDQKAANCDVFSELTANVERLTSEIRDLTRENAQLREMYARVDEEHAVVSDPLDGDCDVEMSALQSKFKLKEQQLENAISEIGNLGEQLQEKVESSTELEQDLTEQREVNVKLQYSLDELREKFDALKEKETDLLQQIADGENFSQDIRAKLENCEADLEQMQQKAKNQEISLRKLASNIVAQISGLKMVDTPLEPLDRIDDTDAFNNNVTSTLATMERKYEEVMSEKDTEIEKLQKNCQKLKSAGKKIIDKLKSDNMAKDDAMKRMASESGNDVIVSLQEERSKLSEQVQLLEQDNDKLQEDVTSLTDKLEEVTLSKQEEQISFVKGVEKFVLDYQIMFDRHLIESDLDVEVFSVISPVMIELARENISEIDALKRDSAAHSCAISSLESEKAAMSKSITNLESELSESQEKNHQSDRQLAELETQLSASLQRLDDMQTQLSGSAHEIDGMRVQLSESDELLQRTIDSNGETINQLMETNRSLLRDIETTRQSATETEASLHSRIEELECQVQDLQAKISETHDSYGDKDAAIQELSDKVKLYQVDGEDKQRFITESAIKNEELERTIDTLSSQVTYLAEERESCERLLTDRCTELEASISSLQSEVETLKSSLESKTAECRKYLVVIKKMKMVKQDHERSIHELEQKLAESNMNLSQYSLDNLTATELVTEDAPAVTASEDAIPAVNALPVVSEHVQSVTHSQPGSDDSTVITETNTTPLPNMSVQHSAVQTDATQSRDSASQSEVVSSCQDDTIGNLQEEVVQLYNELRSVEDRCTAKDSFIASLREQLEESKQLLIDIQTEVVEKSQELLLLQEKYSNDVKHLQNEVEKFQEKEKLLEAKPSLTEAEKIRLMSGKPQIPEPDTVSEISQSSLRSHDTSYMSVSSMCNDMPSDVGSLQAELIKKNKLAFLIKTKAKKLESRVKDAKREADRSKAHEKVKEKIVAIESELTNITAQLRNLSTGKKVQNSAPKIDPKYVEEMESKLSYLSQIEQKYENLMEELQIQLHSRNIAEDEAQQMNHTINDLEDRIELLQNELRDKDALLCEHFDASAGEEMKINTLRDQYEKQNSELLHLRDLNKKMKEALIEVTEESARIEQTYKSTMQDLEEDGDKLKCDNATLSNELTNCWAKIEDLEEQNQNFMTMLEDTHEKLRSQKSDTREVDDLQSEKESLTAQVRSCTDLNQELQEKVEAIERERLGVMKDLNDLKQAHDECLVMKEALLEEKNHLLLSVAELRQKVVDHEEVSSVEAAASQNEIQTLKQVNADLENRLNDAENANKAAAASLSSRLQSSVEDVSLLRSQLDESQSVSEALKQQLTIEKEEKSKTSSQLEKAYNQLNNLISEHEECTTSIKSLQNELLSIQKQLSEKSTLVEILKEEQNIMTESNMMSMNERDAEIARLAEICQKKEATEKDLSDLKVEHESLCDEKLNLEQSVKDLTDTNTTLESRINALQVEFDGALEEKSKLLEAIENNLRKIEQLTNQVAAADVSHEELILARQSEIESLERALKENEDILNQAQADLANVEELKRSKLDLEQQVDTLKESNDQYLGQLQEASYTVEQWNHYNAEQQAAFTELGVQLQTATEERNDFSSRLTEAEGEMKALQEQISKYEVANKELQDNLATGNALQNDHLEELNRLNSDIENLSAAKEQLSEELQQSTELIDTLESELKASKKELTKNQNELIATVSNLETEISSLTDRRDELEGENSELKIKLQEIDGIAIDECNKLRSQVEDFQIMIQERDIKLDSAQSLVLETDQKMHEKEISIEKLNSDLLEKDSSIALLEQQLNDAYSGNKEATNVLKIENQSLKEENDKLMERNANLMESNDTLQEGISKLHDSIEQTKATNHSYEGMLADWTAYGEQREAFIVNINEQLNLSQRSIDIQAAALQSKEHQIAELEQSVKDSKLELERESVEKFDLKNQLSDLSEQTKELGELKATYATLKQEYAELEQALSGLKEELTASNHEKDAITKKAKDIMKAYKESKMLVEKLKKEGSEKDIQTIEDLNTKVKELSNTQASMSTLCEQLKEEKSELLHEVEQFDAERLIFQTLKDENRDLKNSLAHSTSQFDDISSSRDKLQEELQVRSSEISSMNAEIYHLRSVDSRHGRLYEDLGLDFSKIDEVLPTLVNDLADRNKKLHSLNSALESFRECCLIQTPEGHISEEELLKIASNSMKDLTENLESAMNEIQKLKLKVEALEQEAEHIKSVNASSEEFNSNVSKELQTKIEFLEHNGNEQEHTIEQLHQKLESSYQDLENTKTALLKNEEELNESSHQLESTIAILAEAQSKLVQLMEDVSAREEEKIRLQHDFQEQIKHSHDTTALLQEEKSKLQEKVLSLNSHKAALEQDLLSKCNKITALIEELDGCKERVTSLNAEQKSSHESYDQCMSKLRVTESELESVSEQLAMKDSMIQHLENTLASLQTQLNAASSLDKESVNVVKQKDEVIESLRVELDNLSTERSSLTQQLESLQSCFESTKVDLEAKDSSLTAQSVLNDQLRTDLADQKTIIDAVQERCEGLSTEVSELTKINCSLEDELTKLKLDHDVLQKSVTVNNKSDMDVMKTKIGSLQEINEKLENALLKSEEQMGEITADYEQKCLEISVMEQDLSNKKSRIFELEGKVDGAGEKINEKTEMISQLQNDFDALVSTNAVLEEKMKKFTTGDLIQDSEEFKRLSSDLQDALHNNKSLHENNSLLVENNSQLTESYKQLHDSISVYQQRDAYLNDMSQKLQAHITSLEDHIKTISSDFLAKIEAIENEKKALNQKLISAEYSVQTKAQVSELTTEISNLKESKAKLIGEVDVYQGRLQAATSKAENLEKTLLDMTTRYNDQCGVLEKKSADITKLSKQYKYLKQKLVNELNNRKSILQETINGKDKAALQIGEKSKRLKELQGQLMSCQKDRETLTSAVEGILDSIAPFKRKLADGIIPLTPENPASSTLDEVEHKTKDILAYLARPLPTSICIDLSSYRTDSELFSDYSFAPSDTISDSGAENKSLRGSENFSLLSDITNTSRQNFHSSTPLIVRERRGSGGSTGSDMFRASSEISRTSTGVMSRLANSFTGAQPRTQSSQYPGNN